MRNVCFLRTELAHLSAGSHLAGPKLKCAKSAICALLAGDRLASYFDLKKSPG
jgi:hypothetical protein